MQVSKQQTIQRTWHLHKVRYLSISSYELVPIWTNAGKARKSA